MYRNHQVAQREQPGNGGRRGFRSGGASRELLRLLTLERKNGAEQFRFSLDEFEPDDGKPSQYLSMRVWYQDQSGGEWRPGKTGCTIRRGEMSKALEALERAARILSGKEAIPQPVDERQEELGTW